MLAHRIAWTLGLLTVLLAYRRIYSGDRKRSDAASDARLTVKSFRPVFPLVFYSSAFICLASAWGLDVLGVRVLNATGTRDTGLLVALVGTGLAYWAKRTLGRSYSPCYASALPACLIANGPYRWVRHPLYSANLLTLSGIAIATTSAVLIAALAVVAAFYLRAARREERTLATELPGYREYESRTGRFVPCFFPRWS